MTVTARTRRYVTSRAGGCCEYCRIGVGEQSADFHIDHIIALRFHGSDEEANLCVACLECNRFKGFIVAALDPLNGEPSKLYHPRTQTWHEHFHIESDASIAGLTPEGRTTILVLRINDSWRISQRRRELLLGNYPCQTNL